MKKFFIILFISMIAINVTANSNTPLLDSFSNVNSFVSNFTQENNYQGIETFDVDGTLYFIREKVALWDYQDPEEYYLLLPTGIRHYSKELNQLLIIHSDTDNEDDPVSLLLSIFINPNRIKNKFKVNEQGDKVVLVPIDDDSDLVDIVLIFENQIISEIKTRDKMDNETKIMFKQPQYNVNISESVFYKAVPAGVSIVE